jgi:hypothetical protein
MTSRTIQKSISLMAGLLLACGTVAFAHSDNHSNGHGGGLSPLEKKVNKEISDRAAGDKALAAGIVKAKEEAAKNLKQKADELDKKIAETGAKGLNDEIAARTAADIQLKQQLDAESSTRSAADAALTQGATDEAAARLAGDAALTQNVGAEATARALSDGQIEGKLDLETTARSAGDRALTQDLADETAARTAGDAALNARIDALPTSGTEPEAACISDEGESFASGNFFLEIDGHAAGRIVSVRGGGTDARVTTQEVTGPGEKKIFQKSISAARFCDVTLRVQPYALSEPLKTWVQDFVGQGGMINNGAILMADHLGELTQRMEFTSAYISEVRFPTMDASDNSQGYIDVKIHPAQAETKKESGRAPSTPNPRGWIAGNFSLSLAGLPTNALSRVESLSLRRKSDSAPLEISDLSILVREQDADKFIEWYKKFVLEGRNQPRDEKTGRIEMLSADLRTSPVSLNLQGVGITGFSLFKENHGSSVSRVMMNFYLQGVELEFNP